jgi:Na+/melibiose symporter and related transporters
MGNQLSGGMVKTPFKRLVAGITIGAVGMMTALLTPITLLLTLKFVDLNSATATSNFGMTTGLAALFAMLANPIGGAISDRTALKFGRRRTWILIGSILGAACLVGIGFSKNFTQIMILWCLTQIVFNFTYASYTALIPDQVDEGKRGSISGIIGLAMPFSPILGLVVISLMGNASTPAKWSVIAVISVITAVISCVLVKESKVVFKKPEKAKMSFGTWISGIVPSPRKHPPFAWGWLTRFFISLAYCSGTYNSMMLIKRYHYSTQQATSATTLLSLIGMGFLAISSVAGGVLSDKFRKQKPFVAASALVVGVGLVVNATASSFGALLIGNALVGFGYGIFTAVDMALVARILPNKLDAAKDFGIMNIANTVPQSIVPFVGPTLLAVGSWPFFFGTLAFGGVLSALSVIPIPEMQPKGAPNAAGEPVSIESTRR